MEKEGKDLGSKFLRGISLYFLIAIIAISIVSQLYSPGSSVQELIYSELLRYIDDNMVASARLVGDQHLEGTLRDGTNFTAVIPLGKMSDIADRLEEKNVRLEADLPPTPPWWVALLPNLVFVVLLALVWLFIMNQMQGGSNRALSFGKSRARLYTEERGKVTFDDVAGVEEAKTELMEIVEFLKHPRKFSELGAKIPKGVLLVGPPGTGKTLLARAVAGEAGVPFFTISGSEFVEMFVGVGASRVRDLFDNAKKNAPCLVFIDELDAVGRQRGAGLGGGHDEREQTLNQLLVEMDGFEVNSGIIVMAATNRADVLDPALLRPGRFDRKVVVDRPDLQGREQILRIHSRNKPLAPSVDLSLLAKRTPGFSGADLENLLNEAAILAARANRRVITMDDAEEAIDRVIMGPEKKSRVMSEMDKKVFAYHEAGHAVVAHFSEHGDPVHKVTIVGRGMAGGYTMMLPDEERYVTNRSKLMDELVGLLGGRAAEELALGEISTGAKNDLERVTRIARKMVMEWGMSDVLGPLTFGRPNGEDLVFLGRDISRERNYSEEVAATIDKEVRALVEGSYEKAKAILTEHRDKLDAVADALLEQETIEREEFEALMAGEELPLPKGESGQAEEVTEQAVAAYKEEAQERLREQRRRSGQEPIIGEA
ncbi:MAG: ATP-dependent metallopeptidase FtsH/Yme1/Tma family protein [Firmicutes bacterium]|jgi:cell division protease FtsH|nr:ATP-dependent zinc metalloprotease FtsH [Bacillota bacterium]NLO66295.1 ATP-dependent metallopeptidase FtsH/Yme1/Tma family protein [Bacillota bacterium]